MRASKTDPEQQGTTIAISRGGRACPVAALNAWLKAATISHGAIFRAVRKNGSLAATRLSDRAVADIVKSCVRLIGFDPKTYSGHSLRSGFLTSAARRGASIFKMRDVSRHRSLETLGAYVRDAEFFRDHAGTGLL